MQEQRLTQFVLYIIWMQSDLLHRFVVGLRDSYHRSNPYHNFAHAVDVLQATFYFLCRMGKLPLTGCGYPPLPSVNGCTSAETQVMANIPTNPTSAVDGDAPSRLRVQAFLRPEDIFALIVASIGHDVGHPGVNNMFLVCPTLQHSRHVLPYTVEQVLTMYPFF